MTQNNEREAIHQLALECGLLLKTTNLDLCPSYIGKLSKFAEAYHQAQSEQQEAVAVLNSTWGSDTGWQYNIKLLPSFETDKYLESINGHDVYLYLSPHKQSQNEQQEAVTNLWEALGKWSAYLASNGEQANLAPPSWLIDAVSSATSPPKQIPDGWKLVPIEPTYEMLSAVLFNTEYAGDNESLMTTAYKAMINASPTNTEVGE